MEIAMLFATPVGKTDGSKFLPYARSLYDVVPLTNIETMTTSLTTYIPGQFNNNVKIPPSPEFEEFKQFILGSCTSFLAEIGYAVDIYDFAITSIWLNHMKSGDSHKQHCHAGALMSGCFYVDVPANAPGITFFNSSAMDAKVSLEVRRITEANAVMNTVVPKEGDLVFWESSLYHCVPPANFQGARRSIAFDVVATNVKPEALARGFSNQLRI